MGISTVVLGPSLGLVNGRPDCAKLNTGTSYIENVSVRCGTGLAGHVLQRTQESSSCTDRKPACTNRYSACADRYSACADRYSACLQTVKPPCRHQINLYRSQIRLFKGQMQV